ncbi:hypothetical protein FEM08_29430 [Flavobacterium gilvum]|nr:hypothetical protein FEM08_29430 [Flavobacterium gilvum]
MSGTTFFILTRINFVVAVSKLRKADVTIGVFFYEIVT